MYKRKTHFDFLRKLEISIFLIKIVGTANRVKIPGVPMFSANPAKRPRRETIADTFTLVGNSIAQALQSGAALVQQVWMCYDAA